MSPRHLYLSRFLDKTRQNESQSNVVSVFDQKDAYECTASKKNRMLFTSPPTQPPEGDVLTMPIIHIRFLQNKRQGHSQCWADAGNVSLRRWKKADKFNILGRVGWR